MIKSISGAGLPNIFKIVLQIGILIFSLRGIMSNVSLMNEVEIEELLDGNNVLSMGAVGRDRDRDQDRGRDISHTDIIGESDDVYNDSVVAE